VNFLLNKFMKLITLLVVLFYYEVSIIIKKLLNYNKNKFLNDNYLKKIRKSNNELLYKIKNKNLILVESLINHPGYFFKNIILANHLRKIMSSELILLINKNDNYAKQLAKSLKLKI